MYAIEHVKKLLNYKFPKEKITINVAEETLQYLLFDINSSAPFPAPSKPKFKFIDLFAGIGGFRLALQNLKGKCIFTSEWDKFPNKHIKPILGKYHLETLQNLK